MPRLNNDERNGQAIRMLNAGMSATVVSRHFGCTRKIIERLRRRFRVTGNDADRPRSGIPRVTTAADDRSIALQHHRNRRLTASSTGGQYGIHPQTVRNRLRQNVQPIQCADLLYFGHSYPTSSNGKAGLVPSSLHFRRADWDLISFSDECQFNVSHADGRKRVYCRRGERFADACINELDRFGSRSVLV